MTTYRTGNPWGVTIVREQPIDGMTAVDAQLVAVVVNGDQALAERICALLNADQDLGAQLRDEARHAPGPVDCGCLLCRSLRGDATPTTTGNPRCSHCVAEGRRCPACVDRDGPETGLRSTESAQEPPVGGNGRPEGVETLSGGCGCGHEGLPAEWHSRPCPLARVRVAGRLVPPSVGPRCICNDPPPTVDKPKNGTASRPSGWACPRHGAVI